MESKGKAARGRVTCSCGGGVCDSSRYDFFGEASLSKKLASLKKLQDS
jgi:hypothetical protein